MPAERKKFTLAEQQLLTRIADNVKRSILQEDMDARETFALVEKMIQNAEFYDLRKHYHFLSAVFEDLVATADAFLNDEKAHEYHQFIHLFDSYIKGFVASLKQNDSESSIR